VKRKKLTYLIVGSTLIVAVGLIYFFGIRTGKIIPRADVDVATMALNPASGTYQTGQTFDVNIVINTGGIATDAATANLNFDTNYLDVVDMDATRTGIQITPGTIYPNMMTNIVNSNRITFEATIDLNADPLVPFTGTGTLATIRFRTKQAVASTNVTFYYVEDSRDMDNSQIISHASDTILYQPGVGTYQITNTINLSLQLQGNVNHNNSATGIDLRVYQTGQSTIIFEKTDISTDTAGNAQFPVNLAAGNYDFWLKVPYYLAQKKTNIAMANPLTLAFGEQRAGDLNNDNQVSQSGDYSKIILSWRKRSTDAGFDPISDVNKDSQVNMSDVQLLLTNWRVRGAQ